MFKTGGMRRVVFIILMFAVAGISVCFKGSFDELDWLAWTNKCLAQSYNPGEDAKLKKWELIVTKDYFLRFRKVYAKEREEYHSFSLHQFNDFDYLGSATSGNLLLKTNADDIIVQVKNDRHGDIDSMATELNIPVKNMEPERLDSLREAFNYFKAKGM